MKEVPKEIEQAVAETEWRQAREDAAGREAMLHPFPGVLKDVFALDPNVQVGPYSVRPCYDYDLRVLKLAGHPAYDLVVLGNTEKDFLPSDDDGRFLAWQFTTPVKDVKDLVEGPDGLARMRALANAQWEFIQTRTILHVVKAAVGQLIRSISPRLDYEPDTYEEAKPTEAAKAPLPPSGQLLTGSAG